MTTYVSKVRETILPYPTPFLAVTDSGDTEIIPAPGEGRRIHVCRAMIQSRSDTETTFLLKNGTTVWLAVFLSQKGDGIAEGWDEKREIICEENTSVVVNLSAESDVLVHLWAWTEIVD